MNSGFRHDRAAADVTAASGFVIQPALWPEAGISTEVETYMRLSGAAGISLERGGIEFGVGGRAKVDGYFNIFNLGKWRSLCGEMPLELRLKGSGRFQLIIWLAAQDRSWDRIFSEVVTLNGTLDVPLDLTEAERPRTVLFFEVVALSEGSLDDFAWVTTTPPRQYPDLVLSVTTFRREASVAETVRRFRQFRAASDLRDYIRMNVIDNGQTLTIEPGNGVSIIPNENLGGAGGFTRGLLEARTAGATHCLFMDDDASVHMQAITRSWMLLAYATDPRTAVAGAMINADHRWQIWENGAIFERGCRAQYFRLDMRDALEVFEMEFATTAPAPRDFYAGWWFFAFPVHQPTHLPFPFFVRGDDVSFSLANDFRIVTLPGVASIQESFTDKASPLTWYLDLRSHLAHHLSLPHKRRGWGELQRMFVNFYLRTILRFHYDSLSAINLAIEDVLKGPQFFAENADMAQRRKDLKDLTTTEAWQPTDHPPRPRHNLYPKPLRGLLLLTLNGHLLPFSRFFGPELVMEAELREDFRQVYGARAVTYLNAHRTASYTVRRDKRRFWRESFRLLRNSLKLRKSYDRLHREWQDSYPQMTSEAFWRQKLDLPQSGPEEERQP
jgi:galactofuranosylgalactofuranosylrhamnosyl-N-acetylglucosaminyl-diphospho-decaprenol beta-1,5/1,6-galactofuranosyltransferase